MSTLDSLETAVWSLDAETNSLFLSTGFRKWAGYPDDAANGEERLLEAAVYPEDLERFREGLNRLRAGVPETIDYRILLPGGKIAYVEQIGIPYYSPDGKLARIEGIVMDRTECKKRLGLLHERIGQLEKLLDSIDIAVWSFDGRAGQISFVSEALETITGYSNDNVSDLQEWIDELVFEEDVPSLIRMGENILLGLPDFCEYRIRHASGELRWVHTRVIPTLDEEGLVARLDGVSMDITARKISEEERNRSEQRYKSLFEYNSDVIVELDRHGNIIDINPASEHTTGERVLGEHADFSMEEVFGRDNLEVLTEYFKLALDGLSVRFEVTSRHRSGSEFHWEVKYIPIRVNGRIEGAFGLCKNVTSRKTIEKRYQESEERYRRLVELSPIAIAVYKEDRITYLNPAGFRMLGAESREAFSTEILLDWVHPDYREVALRRLEETRANGYVPSGEFRVRQVNGNVIDISLVSIYDPQTSSIQLMFEDITARKRTERILMESEERHYRLQASLDRFSHDLFGVMKISQMERRLVKEVRHVLKATRVSLGEEEANSDGLCQIVESATGYSLKIGEVRGKSYMLRIDEKTPLLAIASKRVWLETIARYVSVLFDHFLLIEDMSKELERSASGQVAPTWLVRLLFNLSENERKRLSQDLHDGALQEQIIWYRKLDQLTARSDLRPELREELVRISQGLLDVVYQIRLTCNELRPPLLMEEGLISALEALIDATQLRANYRIVFDASRFDRVLNDDMLIGLFRIVQELLANAAKHSAASEVRISLSSFSRWVHLEYEDNGIGMEGLGKERAAQAGMGIYGMKERVRSMEGSIRFGSSPSGGLAVRISVPA